MPGNGGTYEKEYYEKSSRISAVYHRAAQSGLSVQAAALTEGSWEQTSAGWKFLNRDRQPYTGWIHTASGWYYLNIGRRKSGNRLEEYQWSGLLFYSGK